MKIVFISGYVLAVLVLFQFISVNFVYGFYEKPISTNSVQLAVADAVGIKTPVSAPIKKALPVRLVIPKIRVNAVIGQVGLVSGGSMGVPKLPSDTVWYKLGPKPGEIGSAVIAGHLNWWYGAIGVFGRLKTLKPGDLISVRDDRGVSTSFVVRKTREYGPKDDSSNVFLSYDGKSHLNLVTCSGIWNKLTKTYSKRLVVFADKVVK